VGKRVELAALKATYDLAALPAKNAEMAAGVLAELLGKKVNHIGNYVGIHLHASNPNIHPGRVYGMWKDYKEGVTYPENPLFYESWDDESSIWVQAISDERTNVWKEICKKIPGTGEPDQVPAIKPYIESIYAGQIADNSTLATVFNTCVVFKWFKSSMKETEAGVDTGCPSLRTVISVRTSQWAYSSTRGIADLAGVVTPANDRFLLHFQGFMGNEYM